LKMHSSYMVQLCSSSAVAYVPPSGESAEAQAR
jgi:hypothetical protein